MSIRQTLWAFALSWLVLATQVPEAIGANTNWTRTTAMNLLKKDAKDMPYACLDVNMEHSNDIYWLSWMYWRVINECLSSLWLLRINKPTMGDLKSSEIDIKTIITENPKFFARLVYDIKLLESNPSLIRKFRDYRKVINSENQNDDSKKYDSKKDLKWFCWDNGIAECKDWDLYAIIKDEYTTLYNLIWILDRNWIDIWVFIKSLKWIDSIFWK